MACRNYAKGPNDTGGEGLHIEGNGTGSKRTLMWRLNMFRCLHFSTGDSRIYNTKNAQCIYDIVLSGRVIKA